MLYFTVLFILTGCRCINTQVRILPLIRNMIPENQVFFYLYTRNNSDYPVNLVLDYLNLMDVNKEIKIMIHGYFESLGNEWYRNMTTEYLKKDDYNVIQVDWSKPASNTYLVSAWNAQRVGRQIAKLITKLYDNHNLDLDKVHIIGHSLGGHVAGFAGREVVGRTGSAIFRITALDPAGPLFEGPLLMFEGLNKDDAKIVDAIHTDSTMFGTGKATGDVDFFPNGGVAPQPGCDFIRLLLPPRDFVGFRQEVFCSHTKSYYYFTASINQEKFIGVKCSSWKEFQHGDCDENVTADMGDDLNFSSNTTGMFFLKTNPTSPFARN